MNEPFSSLFASVCRIATPAGTGTGFTVARAYSDLVPGLLLTCNHVVENTPAIKVSWWDRGYTLGESYVTTPQVLVQDFSRDLALVEVPRLDREPLRVVEDGLQPGGTFVNVGYPLGREYPRFVKGIASGWDFFHIDGVEQLILVLDGTIHCGQSGGPICNERGEVSALVYAKQLAPGVRPEDGGWTTLGIGLAVPLLGLSQMIEAGRDMKYKVATGSAPQACEVARSALARLQHWLVEQVGTPVAQMSCNSGREVWVRRNGQARLPVPDGLRPAVDPMVGAYLARRPSGGRFVFNGRTAYAFEPDDGRYTPLVEVRSKATGAEPWAAVAGGGP